MRQADIPRAATPQEYRARTIDRLDAVSRNRSRTIRGLKPGPVPEALRPPLVPVAYEADGTYMGRLRDAADCPAGCKVRWQEARW